ncbi:hypothetical protein ACN38_g4543 [Penicillium nordicum]|uniref:Uncharacterized protein n=1 Tax=Penicillium nordicum TaxID=229535 RepID=A0A0M9WH13_9EURO|nr:hypothetical protein ACN38_g4543 [Penicillium nordicum]
MPATDALQPPLTPAERAIVKPMAAGLPSCNPSALSHGTVMTLKKERESWRALFNRMTTMNETLTTALWVEQKD